MSLQDKDLQKQDMLRLRRMLQRVASTDPEFQRKIALTEDVQILDLACGACHEAETLTDFFQHLREPEAPLPKGAPRKPHPRDKRTKLTGIDLRAREIADAELRFRKAQESPVDFEFLNGDATKLDSHKELPGEFDVIFIRHQNFWNGAKTWEEIYHKALEKLSPEGRLIITSYFDREHELALEAFQGQGGELLITERNELSRALPTPGKSIDRHVAMLKRKDG